MKIAHMARHDLLTGLPNRVLLRERLNEALAHVHRGQRLAVLYLDLDLFKNVNDLIKIDRCFIKGLGQSSSRMPSSAQSSGSPTAST